MESPSASPTITQSIANKLTQKARRDKRAARNQRFREAAAKAKAKIFNIRDDVKSPTKPNPQAKSNTPFLRNKGDAMPKTAQGPKFKYSPTAFLLGKGPQGSSVPGSGLRGSSITGSPIGDNLKSTTKPNPKGSPRIFNIPEVKSTMAPNPKATIIPKSRPMGPSASAYGEGYDRIWGNKTTPKAFNIPEVKPNPLAEIRAAAYGPKPSSVGPSSRPGGVKSLVETFKKIPSVISETKSKFKNIPAAAVAAFENTPDAAKSGIWEKLKRADDWLGRNQWSIRILKGIGWTMMGLLAAMDMYNLITNWTSKKDKGDMNPFNDSSQADKDFVSTLLRMTTEYGGAYFGAVAGGMVGSMVPLPFIGTITGALLGGAGGAILGGMAGDKINEMVANIESGADYRQATTDNREMGPLSQQMLNMERGGGVVASDWGAESKKLEKEKTKKLEEAGNLDETGKVIFINNYTDASTHGLSQSSSSVSTTINPHDGFVPYEKKGKGPTMQGRFKY